MCDRENATLPAVKLPSRWISVDERSAHHDDDDDDGDGGGGGAGRP